MFDIAIRSLNPLLMIAMPLALGVYLARKLNVEWRLFGLGALIFIVSQVFHIPFNTWVLSPVMEKLGLDGDVPAQLVVSALLLGLSAGIFEEVARYLVYRFQLREARDRTWSSALMLGAGHGGIESVILGILVLYGFIQLFALKDANLENLIPLDRLDVTQAQVNLFWAAPWYAAILGAVERAATLCFHISASVLVLQVFRRRNILWLWLAIGWHTLLNAVAVFSVQTWGVYIAEALIVAAGVASVAIIFLLREPTSMQDPELPAQPEESLAKFEPQKPSLEILEDSRYD
jgi:uncharacterized membrane protein YhfC